MVAKILCHSLEFELLMDLFHVWFKGITPTLDVCRLVFCVIMILKTYIFLLSFTHFSYYKSLEIWLYSANLIFWYAQVALRK